ncbi:hypothetical protein KSS87_000852, partial [Heliosperma pusillum]
SLPPSSLRSFSSFQIFTNSSVFLLIHRSHFSFRNFIIFKGNSVFNQRYNDGVRDPLCSGCKV